MTTLHPQHRKLPENRRPREEALCSTPVDLLKLRLLMPREL